MTLREFAIQALGLLAPLVLALIGWGVARLVPMVRARVRDQRVRDLLETVTRLAAIAVANAFQTTVRDLKRSPDGVRWGATAAAAVKASVVADVRALAPAALQELQRQGGVDIDRLLDQLVEKSVLELKAALGRTPRGEIPPTGLLQPDDDSLPGPHRDAVRPPPPESTTEAPTQPETPSSKKASDRP